VGNLLMVMLDYEICHMVLSWEYKWMLDTVRQRRLANDLPPIACLGCLGMGQASEDWKF